MATSPGLPRRIFVRANSQRAMTLCLALICTIPLLSIDLPPMTDVLGHIGRYAIQIGIDRHPWLKQYYSFDWKLVGNLGADILMQVLGPAFGVEKATKLILILDQLVASLGILLLCRQIHGRITPFCLFALPLIYGHPFNFGFINFTLAMGLALLTFVAWLRLESHRKLRMFLFVPISLLIWLCHTYGWIFLGILCTGQSIANARERGANWPSTLIATVRECAALLAPAVPMAIWRSGAAGGMAAGWFALVPKLGWIISALRLDWPVLDMLSAGGLLALIYGATRVAKWPCHRGMLIAAVICAIAFLALPQVLFGSAYADMRLVPYLLILALLSIRTDQLSPRRAAGLMIAGSAFLILRLALTTVAYHDREQKLEAHLEALSAIPQGSRVVTLVKARCGGWELPWLVHIGGMAITRRSAFSNDQWDASGVNLLSVHYPQGDPFVRDGSQFFSDSRCPEEGPLLGDALAALPSSAFTHVWIVGQDPRLTPARSDLKMTWEGPDSAVYRIVPAKR